jgi:hypothetical protein
LIGHRHLRAIKLSANHAVIPVDQNPGLSSGLAVARASNRRAHTPKPFLDVRTWTRHGVLSMESSVSAVRGSSACGAP